MAVYAYQAFTPKGKKTSGSIEAASLQEAKEKIRQMHLLLSKLELQKKAQKGQRLNRDSLLIFTSQLSQLLSAKIPLYESLVALEEQGREEPHHPVLLGLTERIRRGSSLSEAMADFPGSFSSLYRALISAGEAIGNLELSLNRLNAFLVHQTKIQKQLVSAMIYPALLACLLVVAICILVGFVVPSLEALFQDKSIPQFTQTVFNISGFLRDWGVLIVILAAACITYLYFRLKNPKAKAKIQKFFLRMPLISRYMILSSLGRFARTLSALLDGGLPIIASLSFSKEALNNARLADIMKQAEEKIIEGVPLSHELSRHPEIPPLFARMVLIGEESGKLPTMLAQLATLYEEETERTLTRLVTLAQPLLLLMMGGLIGGVLLSILLPLSSFGSSIDL